MAHPRTQDFKPLGALRPANFVRHPIWGFDLDAGEAVEGADETWVAPQRLRSLSDLGDTVFIRGELRASRGRGLDCTLSLSRAFDPKTGERDPLPSVTVLELRRPPVQIELMSESALSDATLRKFRPEFYWTRSLHAEVIVRRRGSEHCSRSRLTEAGVAELFGAARSRGWEGPLNFTGSLPVGRSNVSVTGTIIEPATMNPPKQKPRP